MRTLAREGKARLTRERSRFLAFVYPVSSVKEIEEKLEGLRRKYRDARHIVCAYRVLEGDKVAERADDAGEPARSAGWPILGLLRGRELANVLVVVVRYFGGVKLGVGGLRRAYRDAAALALEDAGTVELVPRKRLRLVFAPQHAGRVFATLRRCGGAVVSRAFHGGKVVLIIELPADRLDKLRGGLGPWGELEGPE